MPVEIEGALARLHGAVGVEEAEPLAAWLRECAGPAVDLDGCTHLHTAALQALLAARASVAAAPQDPFLHRFVLPALLRRAPDSTEGDPR